MSSVTGDKALKIALTALGKDMVKAMSQGVFVTANEVRTQAIKSIQEQSMGTYVTRSRQGGGVYTHIAAAPGTTPNTDTGALVSSISVEMDWDDSEAEVGSNLDYSGYLEFGTSDMEPRPWLQPAVDSKIDNLQENLAKAAEAVIKARTK